MTAEDTNDGMPFMIPEHVAVAWKSGWLRVVWPYPETAEFLASGPSLERIEAWVAEKLDGPDAAEFRARAALAARRAAENEAAARSLLGWDQPAG